jgi:hypothetical protein
MLSDAGFLSRVQCFDVGVLRQFPEISAFIVAEYFGLSCSSPSKRGTGQRLSSKSSLVDLGRKNSLVEAGRRSFTAPHGLSKDEPLTFQRVHRASHAAGALFRWCTTTLVEVLDPEPDKPKEEVLSALASDVDSGGLAAPPRATGVTRAAELEEQQVPAKVLPSLASGAAAALAAAVATAAASKAAVPEEVLHHTAEVSAALPDEKPSAAAPRETMTPARTAAAVRPIIAVAKGPPQKKLTAATPPDRHFELLAEFDLGNSGMTTKAEAALQTVASTLCVRPSLALELQACSAKIEHEALAKARAMAVQEWFADNSQASSIDLAERYTKPGEEPGVVCKVLLHKDRQLRDFFILRDSPQDGEDITFSRAVKRDAMMLEEDFKTCKY